MIMRQMTIGALVLVSLLALNACRKEQTTETAVDAQPTATDSTMTANTPAPTATQGSLAPADQEFVTKAAKSGMAEVQLATNVTQRAANADVKAFAQKMIEDHNKANQELTTIASSKGVTPPTDIDPDKKALDEELSKLSGTDLDKRYMEEMVKDHTAAVADFEKAAQSLADPDLKAWAAKTLPTLHQHHTSAQEIAAKLK
jgi:putative membrane protein